jgi:hypothetical protein
MVLFHPDMSGATKCQPFNVGDSRVSHQSPVEASATVRVLSERIAQAKVDLESVQIRLRKFG